MTKSRQARVGRAGIDGGLIERVEPRDDGLPLGLGGLRLLGGRHLVAAEHEHRLGQRAGVALERGGIRERIEMDAVLGGVLFFEIKQSRCS